jgi:Kef-type K+ transport system membrane component KefB
MAFDHSSEIVTSIFLIFSGAAVLSTVALFARQSMLVAYMAAGMILGPYGFNLVGNVTLMKHTGDIGIIFLLFLLGLHLPPQKLLGMLKKVSIVGIVSSFAFCFVSFLICRAFGFSVNDSLIVGLAMMFSSTIIGIKLLPTTILHHQHTGEVMISVLLFQDLIAILVLLTVKALSVGGGVGKDVLLIVFGFPLVLLFAYLFERYVLMWLFKKFSRFKEYLFLLSIAWCLGLSAMADALKLSVEIGAFIAGVSLATSPIAVYIAESLKPVRDFFLILFFFSVGALFNLTYFPKIYLSALVLALVLFIFKPIVYRFLLMRVGEESNVSWEVGMRLGQVSEFSLIIAASASALLTDEAHYLVQAVTILSFVFSSYWVVMRYPTPVSLSSKLRRD